MSKLTFLWLKHFLDYQILFMTIWVFLNNKFHLRVIFFCFFLLQTLSRERERVCNYKKNFALMILHFLTFQFPLHDFRFIQWLLAILIKIEARYFQLKLTFYSLLIDFPRLHEPDFYTNYFKNKTIKHWRKDAWEISFLKWTNWLNPR